MDAEEKAPPPREANCVEAHLLHAIFGDPCPPGCPVCEGRPITKS